MAFMFDRRLYINSLRCYTNDHELVHKLLMGWYCLPDSFTWCTNNPETSSRVTLALLGIVFQTKVVEMAISLRWGVDLAVRNLCISTEEQNHLATKVCFYSVKRLLNCQ